MAFVRCLACGIFAVLVAWFISIVFFGIQTTATAKGQGPAGLTAVAGGWEYILHKPLVVILLTVAFGVGFFLCARRA